MDEIYQKFGILNLWGESNSSNETSFEVTEGWLQHASGKIKISHKTVHLENLKSWLAEETKGSGSDAQSLVLRLAWLDVDVKSKHVKLADSVKTTLLDAFDLQLAHRYAQSCITGVTAFPPSNGHQAYSVCYLPKLASVWSHRQSEALSPSERPFLSQGLVFAQKDEKEWLIKFLSSPWDSSLYGHALFPVFLFSLLLSAEIHKTEDAIKKGVRKIEKRTGHHFFANRHEDAATEEIGSLSAQANGFATKLASIGRKAKMLEKLLDFISNTIQHENTNRLVAGLLPSEVYGLLNGHVAVLRDRLDMQNVDTEYTLKRVQIQIRALAGIISRKDFMSNIQLSKAQHEIALHSYRDSSSMKTLAIVTMFFLPGSFISALFSTPVFAWDNADPVNMGVGTKPQFALYWVITVPLTVVTFLLYFLWLWFMKRQSRDRMGDHEAQDGDSDELSLEEKGETEEHRLVRLRRETNLTKKSSTFTLSW